MKDAEKVCWQELTLELPWLHSAHRLLVRAACILVARMDGGEITPTGLNSLSAILSKLGATPADECKINHEDSDTEGDEYFRPH